MFFPLFFCIVTDYAFNDNNGDIEIKKKKKTITDCIALH